MGTGATFLVRRSDINWDMHGLLLDDYCTIFSTLCMREEWSRDLFNIQAYYDITVVTDLRVLVDNNLRFTKHYRSIVNKANHRSSFILKSFQSRNPQLLFRAFIVFVRLMLDYFSHVWAPVYKTDINLIERVQHRFTKRLLGLKDISFHFVCYIR